MALSPGLRLGPYEISGALGAGGMGEVYRARDTRLGRDVAVKVLPEGLSANPEIRARFEREAKTISSLNHPHICVLYDVGREDGVDFLVMELVEGETLAQRLAKGPLSTNDALKVGGQIADALDRAHRAGVVHRDLKPGNVMLTRSGAKLLDFGLARIMGPQAVDESGAKTLPLTQSPTVAEPITAEGTILGTLQYMAPEQLEGREADERADLWALGCVLYEMVTGRRAFEAESRASLIAAIMSVEPTPVSQVVALSPPQLDRLVSACLVKDPADRVQSAHDVKLQLAWIAEGVTSVTPGTEQALPARRRRLRWVGFAMVGVAAAALTALVMTLWPRGGSAPSAPQRYILGTADLQAQSTPVLSPDGTYIVVSIVEGQSTRLYRRSLSSWEMAPIAGTEDGSAPFFSPDGAWIGFCTQNAVKKVPAGGGAAQLIVSYPRPSAGDWGGDGMIYFSTHAGGEDGATALLRVPETGGKAEVVAPLQVDSGDIEAWLPEILPDGRTVLFSILGRGASPTRIVAVRSDGTRHTVVESGFLARYVPGYLLYRDLESEAVLAAPFDAGEVRLTGAAVPLTEAVDPFYCYDVGGDGTLAYVPLPGAGEKEIVWVDRSGAVQPASDTRAAWAQPRISPDGTRVLLRRAGTNCELWILDVARRSVGRIVHGDDNHDPLWSPDGRRIVFVREADDEMVTLALEGSRVTEVIARGPDHGSPQSWSAGGNLLAYTVRGSRTDIWVRPMDGPSEPTAFLATEFDEFLPAVSPDGRWIAYASDETGNQDVFIRSYPDQGTTWQVSSGGGTSPLWSRDGRELYFVVGAKMMAAAVDTQPSLSVGAPVELFDGVFSTVRARDFDVGPDGRFVTTRTLGDGGEHQEIRILLNWPREMARMSGAAH